MSEFSLRVKIGGGFAALFALTSCETYGPYGGAFTSCDDAAGICYRACEANEGGPEYSACHASCDQRANQCFDHAYAPYSTSYAFGVSPWYGQYGSWYPGAGYAFSWTYFNRYYYGPSYAYSTPRYRYDRHGEENWHAPRARNFYSTPRSAPPRGGYVGPDRRPPNADGNRGRDFYSRDGRGDGAGRGDATNRQRDDQRGRQPNDGRNFRGGRDGGDGRGWGGRPDGARPDGARSDGGPRGGQSQPQNRFQPQPQNQATPQQQPNPPRNFTPPPARDPGASQPQSTNRGANAPRDGGARDGGGRNGGGQEGGRPFRKFDNGSGDK